MSSEHTELYEFDKFRLDMSERILWREDERAPLSEKAFDTLCALVKHGNHLVSKDELLTEVWAGAIVEENNLDKNISILRQVLGERAGKGKFIETVRGHGYRFVPEVVVNPKSLDIPDSRPYIPNFVSPNEKPQTKGKNRPILFFAALLSLIVIGSAFFLWRQTPVPNAAVIPFSGKDVVRLTTAGRTKRAAISPDGRYVAHVTEDAKGSSLLVRQATSTAEVLIAGPTKSEYVWTAFAPDGNSVYYLSLDRNRGETELYNVPVLGGPAVKAANDTGPVGFSPDGASIVFIRMVKDESHLIVAAADGSNERVLASRREPEYFRLIWNAPAWSRDGKTIACPVRLADEIGHYETVIGVNVEDGSERPLTNGRWQQVGQPQWLADGLLITAAERSTDPQQVWYITSDGSATRVTHDLNDYHDLSLTTDGTRLTAVQEQVVSSFWVTSDGDTADTKQVTAQVGWLDYLSWMGESRIAYLSNAGGGSDIWIVDSNGSNARQLTTGALAGRGIAVSPDSSQIVFSSERSGRSNIWRVDADGTNLIQLTNGDGEFYPQYTPDGRWIVFQRDEVKPTLWKIPFDGGESIQISPTTALRPAISPDGSMVAFYYLDSELDRSRWSIGIVPAASGVRVKRFDFPPTVAQRFVRWTLDGRSIAFVNTLDGGSDIWLQPLDGSRPRQLTDFKASNIQAFDWSPGGRFLAVIRSVETSDVVLMNNTER